MIVSLLSVALLGSPAAAAPDCAEQGRALNARAFGAVGDGSADDTAALQAAADCLTRKLAPDAEGRAGASLHIPAGTYRVSAPIRVHVLTPGLRGGLRIAGAGPRRTVLLAAGGGALDLVYDSSKPLLKFGFELRDLGLVSAGGGGAAVSVRPAAPPSLEEAPRLSLLAHRIEISGVGGSEFEYGLKGTGLNRPSLYAVRAAASRTCFDLGISYSAVLRELSCVGAERGVDMPVAGEGGLVSGSSFRGVGTAVRIVAPGGFSPSATGGSVFDNLIEAREHGVVLAGKRSFFIYGNRFRSLAGDEPYRDVRLHGPAYVFVSSNVFEGAGARRVGVSLIDDDRPSPLAGRGNSVIGNRFGALGTGVLIAEGIEATVVRDNVFQSSSARVLDRGVGSFILLDGGSSPPSVSISSPQPGAVVSGTVTLAARVSDDGAVEAGFRVDDAGLGVRVASAPYEHAWDSRSVADGTHTIKAVAVDTDGNASVSSPVLVTVDNTPPAASALAALELSTASATLSWTTDEPARARVDFGTSAAFGSTAGVAGLGSVHSVRLEGLEPGTVYHARARVRDEAGNLTVTETLRFSTLERPREVRVDVAAAYGLTLAGVRRAVEDARAHFARPEGADDRYTLLLPPGTHDLTEGDGDFAIDVSSVIPGPRGRLILQGAGRDLTTLVFKDGMSALRGRNAHRVTVKGLHLTWEKLTVTQGRVVSKSAGQVVLEIQPGFPTPGELFTPELDSGRHLARCTDDARDPQLTRGPADTVPWAATEHLGGRRWRMSLKRADLVADYPIGALVAVKSKDLVDAGWFLGGSELAFEDVKLTRVSRVKFRGGTRGIRIKGMRIERPAPVLGQTACLASAGGGPQIGHPKPEPAADAAIEDFHADSTGDDPLAFANASGSVTNSSIRNAYGRLLVLDSTVTVDASTLDALRNTPMLVIPALDGDSGAWNAIVSPGAGEPVSGLVRVEGWTQAGASGLKAASVSIDGGPFRPAVVSTRPWPAEALGDGRFWFYAWDSSGLAPGRHVLSARNEFPNGGRSSFRVELNVDNGAPVIGPVAARASSTTATVSWTTHEPASTRVEYGLDASYGSSASLPGLRGSHAVVLDGLLPGASYHFRVHSRDEAGNLSSSRGLVFRTASDPNPPAAAIVSPSTGAVLSRLVRVLGQASDDSGLSRAELFVDGALHSSAAVSGAAALVRLYWDAARAPQGPHTLRVRVRDVTGNWTDSTPVSVTVEDPARRGSFKVLWGVGTQLEPLADAAQDPGVAEQLEELKSKVDGYVLGGGGGMVGYWPGGPFRCRLNKKLGDDDDLEEPAALKVDGVVYTTATLRGECPRLHEAYLSGVKAANRTYANLTLAQVSARETEKARVRVIRNLGLAAEQARGRTLRSSSLISAAQYSYDAAAGRVSLERLDDWAGLLDEAGLASDTLFVYQEPSVPENMLQVPASPGGPVRYLPDNVRLVDLLGRAYRDAGVDVGPLGVNVRVWLANSPDFAARVAASPYLGDFNLEGGTALLYKRTGWGESKLDNHARAMAWALRNTREDVHLLMAGYWDCPIGGTCLETDTLETRAIVVSRVRALVRGLDQRIKAETSGEWGICNGRVNLTVAAYGAPLHPPTLPLRTPSGSPAGTVGGQVLALAAMRDSYCARQETAGQPGALPGSGDSAPSGPLVRVAGAPRAPGAAEPRALVLGGSSGARTLEFAPSVREASLVSADGRRVASVSGSGGLALSVPAGSGGLGSGLWLIQMKDENGRVTVKPLIIAR